MNDVKLQPLKVADVENLLANESSEEMVEMKDLAKSTISTGMIMDAIETSEEADVANENMQAALENNRMMQIQAMMAADDDIKLVDILQTTQHSTLILMSRAENVTKMSDLDGCRIGTWKVGFSEIPHMIVEEQMLDIEWIKIINPLNLYISGAIDATLAKSYNELILFAMSGITPGSILHFSEHDYDFPEDGVFVSEEYYKNNKEKCRLFAEASRKGWDWVRNNREEAIEIVMKYVKNANVPTNKYNQKWMLETILEAQEDVKGGLPSYKLNEDAFNEMNEALKKYGYISKPISYERFLGGKL